jgi:hypothetical protein
VRRSRSIPDDCVALNFIGAYRPPHQRLSPAIAIVFISIMTAGPEYQYVTIRHEWAAEQALRDE